MDLATLVGMVGAIGIVLAAILTGGSAPIFVNVPSILIVMGGTVMVALKCCQDRLGIQYCQFESAITHDATNKLIGRNETVAMRRVVVLHHGGTELPP